MDAITEGVIIALIGLASGGIATVILKLLEHWLAKAKSKTDDATVIRGELRVELDRRIAENQQLKKELQQQEKDTDKWRSFYWQLYEIFVNIRLIALAVNGIGHEMKESIKKLKPPTDSDQ